MIGGWVRLRLIVAKHIKLSRENIMADEKRIERAKAFGDKDHPCCEGLDCYVCVAQFASIEVAAKLREVVVGLREIHQIGYCSALEHGQICFMCEYIDKLTAEADALEGE